MARLSRSVFAEGVGMLAARWREIPAAVSSVMAKWLVAHECTAEEFIAGVSRAIAEEEFSPSAKRILELGRPTSSPDAIAGAVFEQVLALRIYSPHGLRLSLDTVRDTLGDPVARAVQSTGVQRITSLTDDARPFVQRDFSAAFASFALEDEARDTAAHFLTGPIPGQRLRGAGPVAEIAPRVTRALMAGDAHPLDTPEPLEETTACEP